MTMLERLTDPHGSALIGWLEGNVLYARLGGTISGELGAHLAARFAALIGDSVGVHLFNESSEVHSYDVAAYVTLTDALRAKRGQFKLIVLRPWCGRISASARAFAASLGCLEFVSSGGAFAARLRAAAPSADVNQLVAPDDLDRGSERAHSSSSAFPALLPLPAGVERGLEPVPRTYVFDLSEFEQGCFTATRFEHLMGRPRGSWICVARTDEHALSLARQAALVEWAKPRTRAPEKFTVRFIDGEPPSPSARRR
jgi:hypothetical protein